MPAKMTRQEAAPKNAAIRYQNGGAPKGKKVSLSCPVSTAKALRAQAVKQHVAVSRLLDQILRAHLGLEDSSGEA